MTPIVRNTLTLLALVGLAAACQSPGPSGGSGRANGGRHAATGGLPDRVVPAVFQTVDSDANGYIDTIVVGAYLFGSQAGAPVPIWADGEFEFILLRQNGEPMAAWTFLRNQVVARRDTDTFGRTHSFRLDIRESGESDRQPAQRAELIARFIRADGAEIVAAGTVGVSIGPP